MGPFFLTDYLLWMSVAESVAEGVMLTRLFN